MQEEEFENVLIDVLTGDEKKSALELAMHLRMSGMVFEKAKEGYWRDKPYWHIKYQDECVCFIFIHGFPAKYAGEPEGWIIWTDDSEFNCFADYPLDKQLKEIAWKNVDICGNCSPDGSCAGGSRKTIFGKDFNHVCRTTMIFINPNSEELDCLKRLVEIRREDILSHN